MPDTPSTHSRLLTPEAANRWRYRVMRGAAPNGVLAMVDEIERLYEQLQAYEDEINERTSDQALTLRKLREEQERADALVEQLEAAEQYAEEGWAWLGAALHALGVTHVFEIPDWKENLAKSNAQMAAEKAVAASYPASTSEAREDGEGA